MIHHVQVAMPEGGEEMAVAFYQGVIGLDVVAKPEVLQGRGGVWFEAGNLQLHLGIERPFLPAGKAHVAFQVRDLAATRRAVEAAGLPTLDDVDLPGIARFHTTDPFGNRVEIVSVVAEDNPWF